MRDLSPALDALRDARETWTDTDTSAEQQAAAPAPKKLPGEPYNNQRRVVNGVEERYIGKVWRPQPPPKAKMPAKPTGRR